MRWSTRIMIPGIMIMALGATPLVFGYFNFNALEFAASVISFGLLVFLVGFALRRFTKGFEKAKS
ncbi:MAG: hypothetical protein OK456_00280 [Thaumarchaeota archaeon]|nr:hypothetical protein [Nitrososphaerota archaeon]